MWNIFVVFNNSLFIRFCSLSRTNSHTVLVYHHLFPFLCVSEYDLNVFHSCNIWFIEMIRVMYDKRNNFLLTRNHDDCWHLSCNIFTKNRVNQKCYIFKWAQMLSMTFSTNRTTFSLQTWWKSIFIFNITDRDCLNNGCIKDQLSIVLIMLSWELVVIILTQQAESRKTLSLILNKTTRGVVFSLSFPFRKESESTIPRPHTTRFYG